MQDSNSAKTVVAAVADLMFGSRIRAAGEQAGIPVRFARSVEALMQDAEGASLLLLDLDARWLDAPAAIRQLKSAPQTAAVPIIAFVSHVRTDAIDAARAAGADQVLARSVFVKDLPGLLAGA
jgi:CheY-like chemotaxis protein